MITLIKQAWRGIFPGRPWQDDLADWTRRAIVVFDSPDFAVLRPKLADDAVKFGLAYCLQQAIANDVPEDDPDGLVRELVRIIRRSKLDRRLPTDQAALQLALRAAMESAGLK